MRSSHVQFHLTFLCAAVYFIYMNAFIKVRFYAENY